MIDRDRKWMIEDSRLIDDRQTDRQTDINGRDG